MDAHNIQRPQLASRGTRSPWEAPIHSHIPGPLPSPVTQRKSLSDTPCETVRIPSPISFHFTLFKSASAYVNRAPPPRPQHKTNYTTFRPSVRMCMCVCAKCVTQNSKGLQIPDSVMFSLFIACPAACASAWGNARAHIVNQPVSQSVRVHSQWKCGPDSLDAMWRHDCCCTHSQMIHMMMSSQ